MQEPDKPWRAYRDWDNPLASNGNHCNITVPIKFIHIQADKRKALLNKQRLFIMTKNI